MDGALDRLAAAELVFRRGTPPEAHYTLQKTGQWDRKRFVGQQLHRSCFGMPAQRFTGANIETFFTRSAEHHFVLPRLVSRVNA